MSHKVKAARWSLTGDTARCAYALREAWAEIDHHIETLKERDDYITDLRCEMDRLKEQYARIVVKTKRFEEGNCPLCGYNGPGYFQPDKHPCAKYYHEAGINPSLDEALNSGDGREKG